MHPSGSGVYMQLLKAMIGCWNSSTSFCMVVTRVLRVSSTCCEHSYVSVQEHGSKIFGDIQEVCWNGSCKHSPSLGRQPSM